MGKAYVRDGIAAVVFVEETQTHEALAPGRGYDADGPVVRGFPWAFASDVEDASASPGSRRSVSRK